MLKRMNNSSRHPDCDRPHRWMGVACALTTLLLALPCAVHAERADQEKPLNIEADSMSYDDLKQVNVFTGHVVMTKGTIIVKGDKVVVHQDPEGYQYATATSAAPGLAYFRQKKDGVDEYVEGYGETIHYDGKTDVTTLTTRAEVRRLAGLTKVLDVVRGSVIRYDGQNDFYTAQAGKDVAGPGNPTGRVRATLAPRNGSAATLNGAPATLAPSNALRSGPRP